MKLFYSPFHSIVHKSLVVIQEKGLADQVTLIAEHPPHKLVSFCASLSLFV